MYWEQETDERQFEVPENVVDLAFRINCPTLPVDHAWQLSSAIAKQLPWFLEDEANGLHIIHGADSGNGWERPQQGTDLLHLSRRTHLILRLAKKWIADARSLSGKTLEINGHKMVIETAKIRKLGLTTVLYSRYVVSPREWSEDEFMQRAVNDLRQQGFKFKKALSGKTAELMTPDAPICTRSLMVADLSLEDGVRLQEQGIGPNRGIGCGLFLPQKSF